MTNRFQPRGRLVAAGVVLVLGLLAQQTGVDLSSLGIGGSNPAKTFSGQESGQESDRGASRDAGRDARARAGQAEILDGDADDRIEQAFEDRLSGFMVTVDATVEKTLPDDHDGSRHQRFLIELSTSRTLLVAHNIDLAERIPLGRGDRVRVRGQYEWNDRGGVLHWTHHDPAGRHAGGWIEYEGHRTE